MVISSPGCTSGVGRTMGQRVSTRAAGERRRREGGAHVDVAQGKVDPQRARDVALVDVDRARDDVEPLADVVGEASPLREGQRGPVERGQPLLSANEALREAPARCPC